MEADAEVLRRLDAIVALLALNTAVVVFVFATNNLVGSVGILPLAVLLLAVGVVLGLLGVAVRNWQRATAPR